MVSSSLDLTRSAVSDVGVRAVAAHCTKLRSLTLNECEEVTAKSLVAIAKEGALPELDELEIRYILARPRAVKKLAEARPELSNSIVFEQRDF